MPGDSEELATAIRVAAWANSEDGKKTIDAVADWSKKFYENRQREARALFRCRCGDTPPRSCYYHTRYM